MTDNGLMPQACERCWTRKQKCNRAKPICQQCRTASTTCIERRLGTVLDPADPEAHHSYIESLKKRIAGLEAQLKSPSPPAPHGPRDRAASKAGHTPSSSSHKSSHLGHSYRDSLQAEMGFLSLSAMAEFTGEQASSGKTISFQTLVQAATGVSGSNPFDSSTQNEAILGSLGSFHRNLLKEGTHLSAPDKDGSLNRYANLVRYSLPFLCANQLLSDNALVNQHQDRQDMDPLLAQSPCKVIRVYMAIATGMLMSKEYRYTESFATVFALSAYQSMPRAFSQSSDGEVAQCLTAMAIFSLYSCFGGSAWHLLGLAVTRCISAGMHTARASSPGHDDPTKKHNSRVFWTLYTLDAVLSTSLGRPFAIQDEDISAQMPNRINGPDDGFEDLQAWNMQHAKLLHDIRNSSTKGSLFHFSNYRHWKDTAPCRLGISTPGSLAWFQRYHLPRSTCRGLLAILHAFDHGQRGRESLLILDQAFVEFTSYFEALEKQAMGQDCAFTSLDGTEIFCTAIGLVYVVCYRGMNSDSVGKQILSVVQKPVLLLTHVSERFSGFQPLRDLLGDFSLAIAIPSANLDMEGQRILEGHEGDIPPPTMRLMRRILGMRNEKAVS